MTVRKSLADAFDDTTDTPAADLPRSDGGAVLDLTAAPDTRTVQTGKRASAPARTRAAAAKPRARRPRQPRTVQPAPNRTRTRAVDALDRKETYLWPDQIERLLLLERALERARPRAVGERITANTLIRIAVDVLLDHADQITGTTEAALVAGLRRATGSETN